MHDRNSSFTGTLPIVAETNSELAGDYPREQKNERSLAGNLGKTSSTIVKGLRSQAPGRSRSSLSRQFGLGGMPDSKRWMVCREKTRSTTGVPLPNANGQFKCFSIRVMVRNPCHIFTSNAQPRQTTSKANRPIGTCFMLPFETVAEMCNKWHRESVSGCIGARQEHLALQLNFSILRTMAAAQHCHCHW
jgi:hypothetical protein